MDLTEYIDWLNSTHPESPVTEPMIDQLERGCVGFTVLMQSCDPSGNTPPWDFVPENAPSTKCFLKEAGANAVDCGNRRKFVFSKQGAWKDGIEPTPDEDGTVPNDSIVGNGCRGCFNYVSVFLGTYVYLNHGRGLGDGPQKITFCDKPPKFESYPKDIWCVTCQPCKK